MHRILVVFLLLFLLALLIAGVFFLWVLGGGMSKHQDEPIRIDETSYSGMPTLGVTNKSKQTIAYLRIEFKNTVVEIEDLPGNYGHVIKDLEEDLSGSFNFSVFIQYSDGQTSEYNSPFSDRMRPLQMSIGDEGEISFR